jgi:serine/threonine protein kinase
MSVSFDLIKKLGSGFFGEVWYAKDTHLGDECALKIVPKERVINQDNLFHEAQVLKYAEHLNIVRVLDAGEFDDSKIYIKMEYLKNGSLYDEFKGVGIKLSRAKRLMIDALRGLEYIHSKNMFHGDISPANIMIGDTNEGKLSDFGLANRNSDKLDFSSKQIYQNVVHLAPEVTTFDKNTSLSDIYSCGVTLYRLINGDSFLRYASKAVIINNKLNGTFPGRNSYRIFIPKSFKLLINKAMNADPKKRFQSAEEMRHVLEQIRVETDWEESDIIVGQRWITRKENYFITITLSGYRTSFESDEFENLPFQGSEILPVHSSINIDDYSWDVTFEKGRDLNKLRKNNNLSIFNKTYEKAENYAKKMLQDYVNGKI